MCCIFYQIVQRLHSRWVQRFSLGNKFSLYIELGSSSAGWIHFIQAFLKYLIIHGSCISTVMTPIVKWQPQRGNTRNGNFSVSSLFDQSSCHYLSVLCGFHSLSCLPRQVYTALMVNYVLFTVTTSWVCLKCFTLSVTLTLCVRGCFSCNKPNPGRGVTFA